MPDDTAGYGRSYFYRVLAEAINDLTDHGYDDLIRVQRWIEKLREAAVRSLVPEHVVQDELTATFRTTYDRLVNQGAILKRHPGVSRFTLERVKPKLRAELDRRIMASATLIKLNRQEAIERTLRRFQGWATSLPIGGSETVNRTETKAQVRKALSSLPFEERRVAIDQGHKFAANLNNILAVDSGAIALEWHSMWRQAGYNYREDHKARDGKVYVLRDNWALQKGYMKLAGREYYDQITAVGEEPMCRCAAQYIYTLPKLPPDMMTEKGRAELARIRASLTI